MAKKKLTKRLDSIENYVSKEEEIKKDIILPAIEDHLREQVISFREKGFNDTWIAARLMIHKHIVEKIK
jgi:hypothetical protein